MLKNLKEFYYPKSLKEAIDILHAASPRAAVIAGGTALALAENRTLESLVDISRLDFRYIRKDSKGLVIGALATLQELVESSEVSQFAGGILSRAASFTNARLIRNSRTVGGCIAHPNPWDDIPCALLALSAVLRISNRSERTLSLEDHLAPVKKNGALSAQDIITEIFIPAPPEKGGCGFARFSKTATDASMISVAASLSVKDGTCFEAHLVMGAGLRHFMRLTEVENLLAGKALSAEAMAQASQAVKSMDFIGDFRGSKEYRREIASHIVHDSLEMAWRKLA